MTPSVSPEADRDLLEGARFYTREANAEVGLAFILEYERALALLCGHLPGGVPPDLTFISPGEAHSRHAFRMKDLVALSRRLQEALSPLVALLEALGYIPVAPEESPSSDNFSVSFAGPQGEFSIARDCGQVLVPGPPTEVLEAASLWRAFPGAGSLAHPLFSWLRAQNVA